MKKQNVHMSTDICLVITISQAYSLAYSYKQVVILHTQAPHMLSSRVGFMYV
jgi:hypothetical protein